MTTIALKIDRIKDSSDIRAVIFEIDDTGLGAASVAAIFEGNEPSVEIAFMEAFWDCSAVKVWEETPSAVPCGNHWIIRPDQLSTWETALVVSDELED